MIQKGIFVSRLQQLSVTVLIEICQTFLLSYLINVPITAVNNSVQRFSQELYKYTRLFINTLFIF